MTTFQDLVAKVKNVVTLAPVSGVISRPVFLFYPDLNDQNAESPRNASRRYVAHQNVHSLETAWTNC